MFNKKKTEVSLHWAWSKKKSQEKKKRRKYYRKDHVNKLWKKSLLHVGTVHDLKII